MKFTQDQDELYDVDLGSDDKEDLATEMWGFATAKLPARATLSEPIPIATHSHPTKKPVPDATLRRRPVAKKPSGSKDDTADTGFVTQKKKKNKQARSNRKKQPTSLTQKICQLASPKYGQASSSSSSANSSSGTNSLAAKSDSSKKSANSYAALSEEQDFREAESG